MTGEQKQPMGAFERLREASPTISVGVLTANLAALGSELACLEGTGVQLLHFDVMDGCFVPMMTVGPPLIRAVRAPFLIEAHLMILDPLEKIDAYVEAGADILTVHVESGQHIHRVLQKLGRMTNARDPGRGLVRGVALNPGTPLSTLEPLLDDVEMVSLLAVNPGWTGQAFIESTLPRLSKVKKMIAAQGREILLCVDGGVTRDNISRLAGTGVDLVVTGSAVFDGKAPAENARFLLERLRSRPH